MDGSRLVRTSSDDAPDDVQERLSDGHSRYYREIPPLLAPLPGARALLRRVADLGLQVVLASSAPDDELEILRKVLGCDDIISETTSSRDVDTAKPEPDILQVALDRAAVDPKPCRVRRGRRMGRTCRGGRGIAVHRTAERRHRPRGVAGGRRVTDLR